MDDYCWIHSTFHIRSEFQGNVGCIIDTVLARRDTLHLAAADTPDTAFYQWVPFTLVFQVCVLHSSTLATLLHILFISFITLMHDPLEVVICKRENCK